MPSLLWYEIEGRRACHWSWYCSLRYGGISHAYRGNPAPDGWRVMCSRPRQRYGMAGGNSGNKRKVHMVRDQIVAKHPRHPEARLTRWLCGAYTFEAVLQETTDVICSACMIRSKHQSTEPLPKEEP